MTSIFVVGDIHGCTDLLEELLIDIQSQFESGDRIVFLGDYIDYGPDSRGVVDQILELRQQHGNAISCLKGDHEQYLLEAHRDHTHIAWLFGMSGLSTVRAYSADAAEELESALRERREQLRARNTEWQPLPYQRFFDALPKPHLEFLTGGLDLIYEHNGIVCTHAGLDPLKPLDQQTETDLLQCNPVPLFRSWPGPQTLVVGHTPTESIDPSSIGKPLLRQDVVCLDTNPASTGVLSAIRFPERTLIQVGKPPPIDLLELSATEIIRGVKLMESLSDVEIDTLAGFCRTEEFAAGAEIIREGDSGNSLFVVLSGIVRVEKAGPSGPIELSRLGPGACLGEMALLTGEKRSATVTAANNCVVIGVPKEGLEPILQAKPELTETIAEIMSERLTNQNARLAEQPVEELVREVRFADEVVNKMRSFFGLS